MAKRISILIALDAADEGLKKAINDAGKSMDDLSSSARAAGDKTAQGMADVKAGVAAFGDQVSKAKTQLLAFLTINWAAGKVQEIVQIADAWNSMAARLKLATAGQQEFITAQEQLFDIAQRIGVPIQEMATLYGKLQLAVRQLGGEQEQAFQLTESISQALRISGSSATEAQSALLQFGQALSAGVLRGEEFNSVVENSPRLARALADGLNVPIGRLRKMAEEGKLTADVVVGALMSQKDTLEQEYSQLPATVSQAYTRLENAFGQWVSRVDEATGFSQKLAEAMTWLAENIDTVMAAFKILMEAGLMVLTYRLIPALITAWQTVGAAAVTAATTAKAAWATANLSVSAATASVGLLNTAFAALSAFLVGWEIGTWLSDKFEIVRKAGVFMVEVLMKGIEEMQYRWEAFAAVFTSDTIDEATARHEQRLNDMNGIFAQMYAEAEGATGAAIDAMNAAGDTAEAITKRLDAVRQGTQEAVGRGVEALRDTLGKLNTRIGEVEKTISQANGVISSATANMAQAYKTLTDDVAAAMTEQVDAVKARFEAEKAELELSSQSQKTKIRETTELLTDSLNEQTQLRQQASDETLRLIDEESQARIEAASRQGDTEQERSANVQRVENDILATKRQTLQIAIDEYRQHIDALNDEANRHLTEIQRIEEQKRLLSMSTEERIREIQRQGMSDFEANEDRKNQIQEYQAEARRLLAAGEFDEAKKFAQKAMDLAAQVATTQTSEAKRAADTRNRSEQDVSRVVQLESQARDASRRGEFDRARDLMQQADDLRADIHDKTRSADQEIVSSKRDVNNAIDAIRASEDLLSRALDGEGQAHRSAAQEAISARQDIQAALTQTENQVDDLSQQLAKGMAITLTADSSKFTQALADLDSALAEKSYLLDVQADLSHAEKTLEEYEQKLKAGETLTVEAKIEVENAKATLEKFKTYAKESGRVDLQVSVDKAQAAIGNVERQITALNRIETESRHAISSNVGDVRSQIHSLNNANTSSTHTIYVRRVETNASGGVVGEGINHTNVRAFNSGGEVSPLFPRMNSGKVPGSGNQDTIPRTLDSGSFVLRKAAVKKYGMEQLRHFATGGFVSRLTGNSAPIKKNRQVFEAQKMIELGMKGIDQYVTWLQRRYGAHASPRLRWNTMQSYNERAVNDRRTLQKLVGRKELTSNEQQQLQSITETWRKAMAKPLLWGKDFERDLLDYMEQHQGEFFRRGGLAPSDTVPAMLTPGEYVVSKGAVNQYGADFFAAINNLSMPAQAIAQRVQGFATGGLVNAIASPLGRPEWANNTPARTVRVELVSGDRKVSASIDARDENQFLQLLSAAKARSI